MLRRRLMLRTLLRKERVMLLLTLCSKKANPQARRKGTSSPLSTSL
jgi:hypothetical protein